MAMKMTMKKSAMKAKKASGMKKMMKSMAKKSTMMRRKAMKKSVIAKGYKTRAGANRAVFEGRKMKTVGGLKKDSLVKNKNGKIVSKKASLKGKKNKWMAACAKARANLKLKGFSPIGGKTANGQKLLKLAKSFYKK
jgi:hypothetical protein